MIASTTMLALGMFVVSCGDSGPPTDDGDEVWESSVQLLVIGTNTAVPVKPPSECNFGSAEYSLSFATSQLEAWRCKTDGNAPYAKITQVRMLTSAEMTALVPALGKLQIDKSYQCAGADKPSIELQVTGDYGPIEYRDAFYGCTSDPRIPVDTDALNEVFFKLGALAFGT
jgi:hypothetical protein